jgi:hypothetical protein
MPKARHARYQADPECWTADFQFGFGALLTTFYEGRSLDRFVSCMNLREPWVNGPRQVVEHERELSVLRRVQPQTCVVIVQIRDRDMNG